jgi:hypothetical protein
MTTPDPGEPVPVPSVFEINLPPEAVEGHYADFANIWHNQETFILDFAAMAQPPELRTDDDGTTTAVIRASVVTRVRIPASQVWEVMRALESQLTAWEKEKKATPPPEAQEPHFGAPPSGE